MNSAQQGSRADALGIVQEQAGDVLVIGVQGELDIATVPRFRVAIDGALERGTKRLVIDFTQVTFVDSVSLAVLLTTARKIGDDGRFALVVERDSYGMLIFEAGGIDSVLPLFETRDEALEHARG